MTSTRVAMICAYEDCYAEIDGDGYYRFKEYQLGSSLTKKPLIDEGWTDCSITSRPGWVDVIECRFESSSKRVKFVETLLPRSVARIVMIYAEMPSFSDWALGLPIYRKLNYKFLV